MFNSIRKIIEYLLIFLWEPKTFTISWIENLNNIQKTLSPLIVIYATFVVLFGFISFGFGLYKSYKENELLPNYSKENIDSFLGYIFFNTGLVYYIYAILQGHQINLVKSVVFSLTIIALILFPSLTIIISLAIIIAFVYGTIYLIKSFTNDTDILVTLKRAKRWHWNVSFILNSTFNSILEIRKKFGSGISILLSIGFIICFAIVALYVGRIYVISICTFYNFSVLSWFIIMFTYSVISLVISLVLLLLIKLKKNSTKLIVVFIKYVWLDLCSKD
ncbi:hypothetical protein [Crocosphaera sp.]|uniref:hypothetical protein n=1 Tax=Crocosphaera sp. TaxID=2729996 RepID=UPI0026209136|nr:hypothetical protein [Crocosphaera sp.]MDJ0579001.1 hypothetical protein [Crocosphaera sp.]